MSRRKEARPRDKTKRQDQETRPRDKTKRQDQETGRGLAALVEDVR
jgi:hypothetical protein